MRATFYSIVKNIGLRGKNGFQNLPDVEKLNLVLNQHSNVKHTAQFIIVSFDIRSKAVNKLPMYNPFHLVPHDQCPACHPVQ